MSINSDSYPRLRHGVGAFLDENGNVRFVFFSSSTHKIYSATDEVKLLVSNLNGKKTIFELYNLIKNEHHEFELANLMTILNLLYEDGIIVYDFNNKANINQSISRQLLFWEEVSGHGDDFNLIQSNIEGSKVLILGLGGTGSWIALGLALAGVKKFTIVDFDKVEESNLHRQILFNRKDIGRLKIDASEDSLKRLNPDIEINKHNMKITERTEFTKLVSGHDLVINCTDYPDINTTSKWIADVCYHMGLPHIIGGGYSGHFGMLGLMIIPHKTACWNCSATQHQAVRLNLESITPWVSRRSSASIAPIASIIANIQVMDALRILGGQKQYSLANRKGDIDFNDLSIKWKYIEKENMCENCKKDHIDLQNILRRQLP